MKRLILVFAILALFADNLFSQSVIRVYGTTNAEIVKSQVHRSLDYLNLHNPIFLYISFSDALPKQVKGVTYRVYSVDAAKNKVCTYRIRINTKLNDVQRLNVLAHEMMHVKQFVEGELEVMHGRHVIWKGAKYATKNFNDRSMPWEVDAYRYDQYVARELHTIPKELPSLASKRKP